MLQKYVLYRTSTGSPLLTMMLFSALHVSSDSVMSECFCSATLALSALTS